MLHRVEGLEADEPRHPLRAEVAAQHDLARAAARGGRLVRVRVRGRGRGRGRGRLGFRVRVGGYRVGAGGGAPY